jgi:hypothetical protein
MIMCCGWTINRHLRQLFSHYDFSFILLCLLIKAFARYILRLKIQVILDVWAYHVHVSALTRR